MKKPLVGIVTSNKMNKTVSVLVERLTVHPVYKKRIRRQKKYHAHDEIGAKVGQKVKILSSRPISKTKEWKVVEIIK